MLPLYRSSRNSWELSKYALKRVPPPHYKRDSWESRERKRKVTTGCNPHPELPLPTPREKQHWPLCLPGLPTVPSPHHRYPGSKEASSSSHRYWCCSCSHPGGLFFPTPPAPPTPILQEPPRLPAPRTDGGALQFVATPISSSLGTGNRLPFYLT